MSARKKTCEKRVDKGQRTIDSVWGVTPKKPRTESDSATTPAPTSKVVSQPKTKTSTQAKALTDEPANSSPITISSSQTQSLCSTAATSFFTDDLEVVCLDGPNELPLEFNQTIGLHPSWREAMAPAFGAIGLVVTHEQIEARAGYAYGRGEKASSILQTIYPPSPMLYNWSRLTPLGSVKVVILGCEPSTIPDSATGLAFSQNVNDKRISGTITNIHTELENQFPEFQRPDHGSLVSWAQEGVLLLNVIQTTRRCTSLAHADIGWEKFVNAALELIDRSGGGSLNRFDSDSDGSLNKGLVFLVWGVLAAQRINLSPIPASDRNHLILRSPHPHPKTAHTGFFHQNHFKLANEFLEKTYGSKACINWCNLQRVNPTSNN
ncbi:hypothetical protein CROQUDRAFT_80384 [Cronartium quercuum f. sp. fusiforme G11]|uniref:Uracil-DNA glycosylase-like domain-containing protein n=1 Tax=Cronartium quercuum f. sp. fusiforme G11 TaxID=708437 RepID=A0A9P6NC89_9BASI|nr:hypothetical protein CROQUDRAFT_80384 [Cronartium quercuum f. sp. fusiforme G11]